MTMNEERAANTQQEFEKSCKRYELVKSKGRALELLGAVKEAALDFETTSLSPSDGLVRLTTVCNDDVHFVIDHEFIGPFSEMIDAFKGKRWWVYNGKFEAKWFDYYDEPYSVNIYDVDFAKKAKMGGSPTSLWAMCRFDINIDLDKTAQNSDWSNPILTQGQYDYAAFDGHVTWMLKKKWWDEELTDAQKEGFHVFNDAVRATIEAEETGLVLNSSYHQSVVKVWKIRRDTFERYLRKFTPLSVIGNLRSNPQVGRFLKRELQGTALLENWPKTDKKKDLQLEGKYLRSVSRRLPYPFSRWMAALAGYKYYNKYLDTYGDKLINKQALQGKITSRFNIGQAGTGRYSSSDDNLQNIPRKALVRKSFYSPSRGLRTMCLADYKGIEIRVLAELSGDKQLHEDAIYGDVHAASAAQIYGHEYEYVQEVLASKGDGRYANIYPIIKEQRSKAKGFTFQLLYGAGAGALSDVLRCTFDEAEEAIRAWASRYSRAYHYRQIMFDQMNQDGFLPVCDGRTIFVNKLDRSMPVAANYPIQGAAASVMYRAMYHVHTRFIKHDLPAWIAATVHDELLSYAEREFAEEAMAQQLKGMEEAWLDIFPDTVTDNLTDWAIGDDWSCKP